MSISSLIASTPANTSSNTLDRESVSPAANVGPQTLSPPSGKTVDTENADGSSLHFEDTVKQIGVLEQKAEHNLHLGNAPYPFDDINLATESGVDGDVSQGVTVPNELTAEQADAIIQQLLSQGDLSREQFLQAATPNGLVKNTDTLGFSRAATAEWSLQNAQVPNEFARNLQTQFGVNANAENLSNVLTPQLKDGDSDVAKSAPHFPASSFNSATQVTGLGTQTPASMAMLDSLLTNGISGDNQILAAKSAQALSEGFQTAPKLQLDQARWGETMLQTLRQQVTTQIQLQQQQTTIRLDPPELGALEIFLQHDNGRINIQINATQSDVARLLQQTSDRLRQELTQQAFVEVNVDIQQGQSHAQKHNHPHLDEDSIASSVQLEKFTTGSTSATAQRFLAKA